VKLFARVVKSNKFAVYPVSEVHPLNAAEKLVAPVQKSNNPDGISNRFELL
jgi:hypothetical protein